MDGDLILKQEDLELNDPQERVWVRVRDAVGLLWRENPKLHDLGSVAESISRHGLRIIPNFDSNLPNVSQEDGEEPAGAIVDGNGRIEALARMERNGSRALPRGLALDSGGAWCVPINVGVDAASREQAEAFALDANSLVLAGSEMSLFEMGRIWNENEYRKLLVKLGKASKLPVSLDGDSLDILLRSGLDGKNKDVQKTDLEKKTLLCPHCGMDIYDKS